MPRARAFASALVCAGIVAALTFTGVSASQAPRFGTGQTYKVGEQVPALRGTDLDGQPTIVDYAKSTPTVLYFVTPNGHFVTQNERAFASLVRLTSSKYHFVVVAGTNDDAKIDAYLAGIRPAWGSATVGVVKALSPDMIRAIRMGGYPRTLVVSPSGRVLLCVEGTFEYDERRAIETFFGISLD